MVAAFLAFIVWRIVGKVAATVARFATAPTGFDLILILSAANRCCALYVGARDVAPCSNYGFFEACGIHVGIVWLPISVVGLCSD